MAAAGVAIGQVREPWQLYPANAVLAFGWAGTSLGMITNTLGPLVRQKARHGDQPGAERRQFWRHRRRAAAGGWRSAISAFPGAMIAAAIAMVVLMVPVILIFVGRPPVPCQRNGVAVSAADAPSPTQIRARAFRDIGFLSVSSAFALVLFAQVGFIVHLISFLDSVIGRERAAIAVALLTAMAVVGRVLFSFVIDRMNQRLASALSFVSQAVALVDRHQRAQ